MSLVIKTLGSITFILLPLRRLVEQAITQITASTSSNLLQVFYLFLQSWVSYGIQHFNIIKQSAFS